MPRCLSPAQNNPSRPKTERCSYSPWLFVIFKQTKKKAKGKIINEVNFIVGLRPESQEAIECDPALTVGLYGETN